jgi:hypothetical protein
LVEKFGFVFGGKTIFGSNPFLNPSLPPAFPATLKTPVVLTNRVPVARHDILFVPQITPES